MKPDLDAIRARCDAATSGPWEVEGLEIRAYPTPGRCGMVIYDEGGHEEGDAQFIAAARTDVPALLAYIDELERDLLNERATFESCNRARMHCEYECATLKARIVVLEGMKP